MQLNISYPVTGAQKVIEIEDDNKLRAFYDKRISHEVAGDPLGDDFKGYVFRISGGNRQAGLLYDAGHPHYGPCAHTDARGHVGVQDQEARRA